MQYLAGGKVNGLLIQQCKVHLSIVVGCVKPCTSNRPGQRAYAPHQLAMRGAPFTCQHSWCLQGMKKRVQDRRRGGREGELSEPATPTVLAAAAAAAAAGVPGGWGTVCCSPWRLSFFMKAMRGSWSSGGVDRGGLQLAAKVAAALLEGRLVGHGRPFEATAS